MYYALAYFVSSQNDVANVVDKETEGSEKSHDLPKVTSLDRGSQTFFPGLKSVHVLHSEGLVWKMYKVSQFVYWLNIEMIIFFNILS